MLLSFLFYKSGNSILLVMVIVHFWNFSEFFLCVFLFRSKKMDYDHNKYWSNRIELPDLQNRNNSNTFQNCLISFQNLPQLPNQFLEKAIIEIDFFQQKSIVQFKFYQKSPLVEMASVMSI